MECSPDFATFSRSWRAGRHQTVITSLIRDTETPVSAMQKLGGDKPYSFLLESIEGGSVRGRYSIIGREPDLIWKCEDGGNVLINRDALHNRDAFKPSPHAPLDDLRALIAECRIDEPNQPPPMAAGLFGYLGYEMSGYLETLPRAKGHGLSIPEAVLIRPTLLAIFDQIDNRFTLVTPVWYQASITAEVAYQKATERLKKACEDLDNPLITETTKVPKATRSQPSEPTANMTEKDYCSMVERAKAYIGAGDIFQVVLSQRLSLPFSPSAFSLYRSVRRHDPSPFLFFFDLDTFSVVGSSPEILVRVRDNKVTIRPIAGTRPRGLGNHSDQELERDLLSDPKELAEHLMLLDLGRNDVGRCSKIGSVKVTARNTIEHYRHVMHIVSNVEGELDPRFTPLDAVMGGFPAGTVSGAPKIRAMEIIAELEPDRRRLYAGCIGYFGANGNVDTCIAIRTAVVKAGVMHVQAGAGIVYDSDPMSEYRECLAKARGLIKAALDAV